MDDPASASMDAAARQPDRMAGGEELRIALSMRGGVSLAVWIGGAVQELDRLTRTERPAKNPAEVVGGPDFYESLLWISGYQRATLDVITGASAGGLNGVVLAASRAYGFDFAAMLQLWIQLGDIELLSRDPGKKHTDRRTGLTSRRPPSLLRGDEFFQTRLREQLSKLIREAGNGPGSVVDPFDLILSATLVTPSVETTEEDAFSPLPEVRRDAEFHFRYLGRPGAPGGDFQDVASSGQGAASSGPESTVSLLALAGRATSSFPVAFEPAEVTTHASGVFSDPPLPNQGPRLVLDGGVLDNIPVTKAIEAIAAAPVMGKPDRWLVFLHPSPSERPAPVEGSSLASPRALGTLLITASTAFSQESLLNDLDELNTHNSRVREQRSRRSALLISAMPPGPAGTSSPGDLLRMRKELRSLAASSFQSALAMRATLDALRAITIIEGDRRVRRPVLEIDRVAKARRRRRVPDELYREVRTAYSDWFAAPAPSVPTDAPQPGPLDSPPEAVPAMWRKLVFAPPSLRLQCSAIDDWLGVISALADMPTPPPEAGRSPDGAPGAPDGSTWVVPVDVLRRAQARVAQLRRVVELAQNWSDQAWVMSSATESCHGKEWADHYVTLDATARGCVARPLLRALDHAYPLDGTDPCDGRADVDLAPEKFLALLEELDQQVRVRIRSEETTCDPDVDLVDIGAWIFDRLCDVVSSMRAAPDDIRIPDDDPDDVPVRLLHAGRATPRERLSSLAIVLTRAITGETESDDDIRFVRITGSNETPLRGYFVRDDEPFGADQKLCGNDLGNFAAFVSARWRANDWMWGRMDSVKSIVDLTIRPERLRAANQSPEAIVQLALVIADRAGVRSSSFDATALRDEVATACNPRGAKGSTTLLRRILTEAMQRQIFDEMGGLVGRLDDRPIWPADAPEPRSSRIAALSPDVDKAMRTYRVGSESLGDIDSKRRTSIGMRLAMVTYSAMRPQPRAVLARAIAAMMSVVKPAYLFTAFGALNVARAVFVLNLTAVGFWVGPWRYRFGPRGSGDARSDHVLWELFVGRARWPSFHWHEFDGPGTLLSGLGFAFIVVLSLLSLILAVRHLGKRRAATQAKRAKPKGLLWYVASFVVGAGGLVLTGFSDTRTGPLSVMIGAAVIALLTCIWMRPRYWPAVFLGTAAVYAIVGLVLVLVALTGDRDVATTWYHDVGWGAVIALYAAMAWIAILCTYRSVAPTSSVETQP